MRSSVRHLARRVPAIAWACAAVALLNGVAWSFLTPPFQSPDEVAHVAYVQRIAETGRLPEIRTPDPGYYSPQEQALIASLRVGSVAGQPQNPPLWTAAQTAVVRRHEREDLSRKPLSAASASSNRPLFYALGAAVYRLSPSDKLLDRIVLLRLMTALMSALTVGLIVLFLRELMPRAPWAWATGGVVAAFQPMFGFISGSVNPDALVFLLSAALFLITARILRRGLTARTATAIGLVCALGWLSKPIFLGLLPGAALAVLFAVGRTQGVWLRPAHGLVGARNRLAASWRRLGDRPRTALLAIACFAVPLLLYAAITATVWTRPIGPTEAISTAGFPPTSGLREQLSFMWQEFLPRLPFMTDFHPGFALHSVWLPRFVGSLGLLDYGYPGWIYDIAWGLFIALALFLIVAAVVCRRQMRPRLPELLVYAAMVVGIALAIALSDWNAYTVNGPRFLQGRYLLPLLPLYAALFAAPVRILGRRWGPALGAVVVVAAISLSLYGQVLTVVRYYT